MKTLPRDKLFFDQYEYSMRLRFLHSGCMRTLTHKSIKQSVNWASMYHTHKQISPEYQDHMLALCDFLNTVSVPYKRVVYSDWQYFYSNHCGFFADLEQMSGVHNVTYSKAAAILPPNTVVLQQSDYQWRSYFRERWYTTQETQTLRDFLLSRPSQFKITDLQRRRMGHKHFYISRSLFVDHHDQRDAFLLNMVLPGCMRKTMPIVVRQ